MSNEYGYGVVDSENNPVFKSSGGISFGTHGAASGYVQIINATPNLNEVENTPWRVVKLTWSEIDE